MLHAHEPSWRIHEFPTGKSMVHSLRAEHPDCKRPLIAAHSLQPASGQKAAGTSTQSH